MQPRTHEHDRAFHRMDLLEQVAPQRAPGYLDAIARIGEVCTRDGRVLGYWLTLAQELDIREKFNPSYITGIGALKELLKRKIETDAQSVVVKDRMPAARAELFDPSMPCTIPGLEKLRDQYEAELADMPEDCSDCEISTLRAKYEDRLRALVAAAISTT